LRHPPSEATQLFTGAEEAVARQYDAERASISNVCSGARSLKHGKRFYRTLGWETRKQYVITPGLGSELKCPEFDVFPINMRGIEEYEERRLGNSAVQVASLVCAQCVSPTVKDAVVTDPIPLLVFFVRRAWFSEYPIAENHTTGAPKPVVRCELLRPYVVTAEHEKRQVGMKELVCPCRRRLAIHLSCD
jgi:hypothetical protein